MEVPGSLKLSSQRSGVESPAVGEVYWTLAAVPELVQ